MHRATPSSNSAKRADTPLAPTAVDLKIARYHGKTVALEATPEGLQASKGAPIPDISQRIYELTKENGRLRLEVKYYQDMQDEIEALKEDAKFVAEMLETGLLKFSKVQKEVEDDWCQAMAGVTPGDRAMSTNSQGRV